MKSILERADEIPVTMVVGVAFLTLACVTDPLAPTREMLVHYGAARAIDVADGEPWRLVTYAFLHGSWWHLAMNVYALATIGPVVEQSLGSARFAGLWLFGAIAGGAAGCLWHHPLAPLVGGSGALFALDGALLALLARGDRDPTAFARQPVGRNLLANLAANLLLGVAFPIISNAAHLGGLVAGFFVTWYLLADRRADETHRRTWPLALLAVFVGALVAVLQPVVRADRLLLHWEQTAPGPRRDALRAAFGGLYGLDPDQPGQQLDDATMADLCRQQHERRRVDR